MTYSVLLTGPARRDLQKLPDRVLPAVVQFLSGPLAEAPQRVGKPLVGELEGLHSARRGEYRVIYRIVEDRVQVEVVRLRYRRDAYRGTVPRAR